MAVVLDAVTAGLWPLLVDLERSDCLDEWGAAQARVIGHHSLVRESLSPEVLLQPGGTNGREVQLGAAPASVFEEGQ